MRLRPGFAQTPLVELTVLPRLAIWLMWRSGGKGRGRSGLYSDGKFLWRCPFGSAPHHSSPSPAESPVWQRLDPPVGRGNTGRPPAFFSWRLESLLYEGIIYVLY